MKHFVYVVALSGALLCGGVVGAQEAAMDAAEPTEERMPGEEVPNVVIEQAAMIEKHMSEIEALEQPPAPRKTGNGGRLGLVAALQATTPTVGLNYYLLDFIYMQPSLGFSYEAGTETNNEGQSVDVPKLFMSGALQLGVEVAIGTQGALLDVGLHVGVLANPQYNGNPQTSWKNEVTRLQAGMLMGLKVFVHPAVALFANSGVIYTHYVSKSTVTTVMGGGTTNTNRSESASEIVSLQTPTLGVIFYP